MLNYIDIVVKFCQSDRIPLMKINYLEEIPQNRKKIELKIVDLFVKKVKGKVPDTSTLNIRHDGRGGHWLETQMGISHNANNNPDLFGFEMKNATKGKTTFGDWSANYYIFNDKEYGISRDKFLSIFGGPNILKKNRYSWSGRSCPKINTYNIFGQILKIDQFGNISAIYSYKEDKRVGKSIIVPKNLQKQELVLAKWNFESLTEKVENKFNKLGWFKCLKGIDGSYSEIVFGEPITFNIWIKGVRDGHIFFDSGMYAGNSRNYSQWRANNDYWNSLITTRY